MPSRWGTTPRESVAAECTRRGPSAVVAGCVRILTGDVDDDALIRALGGPPAEPVLAGRYGGRTGYWPRVWAARGLSYVWSDDAVPALLAATTDDAWRVREMVAKVIAKHRVDDGLEAVLALRGDPVPRVRTAAERAVRALASAGG